MRMRIFSIEGGDFSWQPATAVTLRNHKTHFLEPILGGINIKITFIGTFYSFPIKTDLKVCRLQCGLRRNPHRCFIAESRSLLKLRSRCVRWDGMEIRAEARTAQLFSDKLQSSSLESEANRKRKNIFSFQSWVKIKKRKTANKSHERTTSENKSRCHFLTSASWHLWEYDIHRVIGSFHATH